MTLLLAHSTSCQNFVIGQFAEKENKGRLNLVAEEGKKFFKKKVLAVFGKHLNSFCPLASGGEDCLGYVP